MIQLTTKWAGETMHGSKAGIGEAKTRHQRASAHISPRVDIFPIQNCSIQAARAATHTFYRKSISHCACILA
jgi:hypothetical protein